MLDRAFRLSSNWTYFSEECDRLKLLFSRLEYPDDLINSKLLSNLFLHWLTTTVQSPFGLSYHSKTKLQLIFFARNWKILAWKQTPPSNLFSSATRLSETWNHVKSSRRSLTNSPLCIILNVTCAMQVMLVLRAGTCTKASMSTKTHRHQLENIFARNILWSLKILLIITFRY